MLLAAVVGLTVMPVAVGLLVDLPVAVGVGLVVRAEEPLIEAAPRVPEVS